MHGRAEALDRVLRRACRVALDPDDRHDDELAPSVAGFRDERGCAAIEDARQIVERATGNIKQHVVRAIVERLEPLSLGLRIPDVFGAGSHLRVAIGIKQREAACRSVEVPSRDLAPSAAGEIEERAAAVGLADAALGAGKDDLALHVAPIVNQRSGGPKRFFGDGGGDDGSCSAPRAARRDEPAVGDAAGVGAAGTAPRVVVRFFDPTFEPIASRIVSALAASVPSSASAMSCQVRPWLRSFTISGRSSRIFSVLLCGRWRLNV